MAKTVKEAKADIFLRDTDSQSLFNNSGVLSFRYYHEWNDCYNPATDETVQINGEVYDETTNSYKPNCPEGFNPVFNGRLSALWDNIVNCFPNEVESMYKSMRGNGLTYQDMLTKYKDFWKCWCENLYNADAFGYANTNNFTKAYGDKVQVTDYFFGKRQRYLDSKYHCGSSVSNNLRLRLYEDGRGLAIKHYQAIYCTLQWGVNNFDDHRNIKPGTYSYMPFKFSNPQDATFDIDDADLITELSTYTKGINGNYTIYGLEGLGDFKFDLHMDLLKRLTKFVMNYTASKPNTREAGLNFDLSKMGMLRQVIVRNVKNLKKSIILSSDLLEEIDFTNTPITGVTTPPTDMLTKLVLPNSIKELNLVGYTNLQARYLQVAGYSNIETLHIEDCPNLDSYEIVKSCYDSGAKLNNVVLKGINWNISNIDILISLANKGATLQGKIVVTDVSVDINTKILLIKAFGDIDNENNSLFITYPKVNIERADIFGDTYFYKIGKYPFSINAIPNGNNVTAVSWSISDNDFAFIEESTGILHVNKIGNIESNDGATISVSLKLETGETITSSKDIFFYKEKLTLGAYLFNDATYSKKLMYGKIPVAVCVYIEPKNREYATFMALSNLSKTYVWGIDTVKLPNIEVNNTLLNVYDIKALTNIYSPLGPVIDDAHIYDGNISNDGFKVYNKNTTIGDIGFTAITSDIYAELKSYFDDINLGIGDMIAAGQLNTLRIISHRDVFLTDSNINLLIPRATSDYSEREMLDSYIANVITRYGKEYQAYYYPAASYSYAYEPTISKLYPLDEKISAHKWFLPSSGEMVRAEWHSNKGVNNMSEHAIFSQAYIDGRFTVLKGIYNSSTELNSNSIVSVSNELIGYDSGYGLGFKSIDFNVRPMISLKITD
jgi:hypothetical protein